MTRSLTCAKRPCGSCPYRKDVPSGVWSQEEYDKLPRFDGMTPFQDPAVFMCHQRDGHLCAGWVACHGTEGPTALLALRMAERLFGNLDSSVLGYTTDVPVFASGAEAREHGMRDIDDPGPEARGLVSKLLNLMEKK